MSYTRKFELNTIELELVENALRGELNKAQSLKEGCNDPKTKYRRQSGSTVGSFRVIAQPKKLVPAKGQNLHQRLTSKP